MLHPVHCMRQFPDSLVLCSACYPVTILTVPFYRLLPGHDLDEKYGHERSILEQRIITSPIDHVVVTMGCFNLAYFVFFPV
jgi:hypothetical protein